MTQGSAQRYTDCRPCQLGNAKRRLVSSRRASPAQRFLLRHWLKRQLLLEATCRAILHRRENRTRWHWMEPPWSLDIWWADRFVVGAQVHDLMARTTGPLHSVHALVRMVAKSAAAQDWVAESILLIWRRLSIFADRVSARIWTHARAKWICAACAQQQCECDQRRDRAQSQFVSRSKHSRPPSRIATGKARSDAISSIGEGPENLV